MFGLACFAVSMWQFAPITHDWGYDQLLLPQALRGIGQQFAVPPTVTLTLGSLPPARLKLASGLFNLMRNLGGAIGIALCATLLNERTNFHFYRLCEHLNSSNDALLASGGSDGSGALQQLWQLTYREALTLTFSDTYLALLICLLLTTALVPLMRRMAAPSAPSADAH
jgi:DHA2 family multidrug resistance protein